MVFSAIPNLLLLAAGLALSKADGSQQTCSIEADSLVTTFGGSAYHNALPCRYQMVDYRIETSTYACRPRVFAHGARIQDRIYVNGFDVRVSLYSDPTSKDEDFFVAVKAWGRKVDGGYETKLAYRHSVFDPNIKFQLGDDISPLTAFFPSKVNIFEKSDDGSVRFYVEGCGLDLNFNHVLYDLSNADTSGVSITIPSDVDEYFYKPTSACFPYCITPDEFTTLLGYGSTINAFTYQLASNYRPNAEHENTARPQCTSLKTSTRDCAPWKRSHAIAGCLFIVTDQAFLGCISSEEDYKSEVAMTLLNTCVQAFCTEDTVKACSKRDTAFSDAAIPSTCVPPSGDLCVAQ